MIQRRTQGYEPDPLSEKSPIDSVKGAIEAIDDAAEDILEVGERVARTPITPSFFTLPVACLELIAAGIVLMHASEAVDMVPVVYAAAFVLNLFLLAAFHYFAATVYPFLLWCFLLWKGFFSMVLAFILWERAQPHKVWTGSAFELTEPANGLVVASTIMLLTTVSLVVYRIVLSTERLWTRTESIDA